MENTNFEQWAVLEIFGHEKYAGLVTTETIVGSAMIKLEVPEVTNLEVTLPAFVKLFNHASVYSITPVSEQYARSMAAKLSKQPIQGYEHEQVITQLAKRATEKMTLNEIKKLMNNGLLEAEEGFDEMAMAESESRIYHLKSKLCTSKKYQLKTTQKWSYITKKRTPNYLKLPPKRWHTQTL